MVLDDLFQNVPNHRILLLHQFLGLLDGGAVAALFQAVIDERLEQFQRHLLGKTALVQLEIGTDHDHRTAGVIHALAEQVLAETALLALQRIGERFQRAVVGAAQHTAAASVVEQRIHRFLQHALFIAHDHVRRVQLDQLLQPVVAVDHAAVQVVLVDCLRESAATEIGFLRARILLKCGAGPARNDVAGLQNIAATGRLKRIARILLDQ